MFAKIFKSANLTGLLSRLFLLSLIIHTLAALPQRQPYNMDEAYHTINAMTLARGEGFVENFIWNYLNPPADVAHPGNLYWMPLSSIIAWAGMSIGGISYLAGQGGFILLAALLPPLGYWIAWSVSRNRRHAWVVALLMLFSGFYFPVWTAIDGFTPFALSGALCLFGTWRMVENYSYRWAGVVGLTAGLAHLTRADGPLLLITAIFALLAVLIGESNLRLGKRLTPPASRITILFGLMIAGYLMIMLPWFVRNVQVAGAPLPPGGSKTMWLQNYEDIFSYNKALSWQSYLAWGWGPILRSKMWAGWINLQTLFAVQGLIVAFPLAVIGWWEQRNHPLFQISLLYLALLVTAMTLVFTFPGPRGALFHSGGAILPFVFSAAMIGLDRTVQVVARRRTAWRAQSASIFFSGALVFFALAISLFVYSRRVSGASQINPVYPQIVRYLEGQQATVMVGNPPAYLYYGGYRAMAIPNNPMATILQVADRYNATYLVLDINRPAPLSPYFTEQATHPQLSLEATFTGPTYLYRILVSSQ
jgi:hypothetical protein